MVVGSLGPGCASRVTVWAQAAVSEGFVSVQMRKLCSLLESVIGGNELSNSMFGRLQNLERQGPEQPGLS